jgi:hypothetical protein
MIRAGAPERGASAKRSSIPRSLSGISYNAAQRSRQRRTVSTLTALICAISALLFPSPAASTIHARKTSCCGLPWRLVSRTHAVFSSSHNVICVARFGIDSFLAFSFYFITKIFLSMCTSQTLLRPEKIRGSRTIVWAGTGSL